MCALAHPLVRRLCGGSLYVGIEALTGTALRCQYRALPFGLHRCEAGPLIRPEHYDSLSVALRAMPCVILQVEAGQDAALIFPPVLTIEYTELDTSSVTSSSSYGVPTVSFQMEYVRSNTTFVSAMLGLFVVALVSSPSMKCALTIYCVSLTHR